MKTNSPPYAGLFVVWRRLQPRRSEDRYIVYVLRSAGYRRNTTGGVGDIGDTTGGVGDIGDVAASQEAGTADDAGLNTG
jgi:hypothetical protein